MSTVFGGDPMFVEPHTHPLRPTLKREEVEQDVLELAEIVANVIKPQEMWYILQTYKDLVVNLAFRWENGKGNAAQEDYLEKLDRAWEDIKANRA